MRLTLLSKSPRSSVCICAFSLPSISSTFTSCWLKFDFYPVLEARTLLGGPLGPTLSPGTWAAYIITDNTLHICYEKFFVISIYKHHLSIRSLWIKLTKTLFVKVKVTIPKKKKKKTTHHCYISYLLKYILGLNFHLLL